MKYLLTVLTALAKRTDLHPSADYHRPRLQNLPRFFDAAPCVNSTTRVGCALRTVEHTARAFYRFRIMVKQNPQRPALSAPFTCSPPVLSCPPMPGRSPELRAVFRVEIESVLFLQPVSLHSSRNDAPRLLQRLHSVGAARSSGAECMCVFCWGPLLFRARAAQTPSLYATGLD